MNKFTIRIEENEAGWIGFVFRRGKLFASTLPLSSEDAVFENLRQKKLAQFDKDQYYSTLDMYQSATNEEGNQNDIVEEDMVKELSRLVIKIWEGKAVDLNWENLDLTGFTEKEKSVLKEVFEIPYGQCLSYQGIAEQIGNKNAMRFVGNTMGKNRLPLLIPCHRVVASKGLGNYSGEAQGMSGVEIKRHILKLEGISV